MLENKEFTQVVGSADAPYLNQTLIPSSQLFTQFYATEHPSLPNYLVVTSGQHGSCVSDTCGRGTLTNDNLFSQLDTAGQSWGVYAEGMPSNCYLSNSGGYLVRHNPPTYYSTLAAAPVGDGSCPAHDVPYTKLASDITANALPAFSMIIPNQYHDMHTDHVLAPCNLGSAVRDEVCQGDAWLQTNLPPLLSDGGHNDVTVLVLFDEGSSGQGGGGRVMLTETGPGVCSGCTSALPYDQYGLADALEGWFGLGPLRGSAPPL